MDVKVSFALVHVRSDKSPIHQSDGKHLSAFSNWIKRAICTTEDLLLLLTQSNNPECHSAIYTVSMFAVVHPAAVTRIRLLIDYLPFAIYWTRMITFTCLCDRSNIEVIRKHWLHHHKVQASRNNKKVIIGLFQVLVAFREEHIIFLMIY